MGKPRPLEQTHFCTYWLKLVLAAWITCILQPASPAIPRGVQHESQNSSQAEVANNSISPTELKVVFYLNNAVFWTTIISFGC